MYITNNNKTVTYEGGDRITSMTTHYKRRRRVDPKILDKIEEMGLAGYGASKIYDELQEDETIDIDKLPDLRTVQRIIREDILPQTPSGTWTLNCSKGDDIPVILKTLVDVISNTKGRITSLTRAEAEWIIFMSHAAPDLSPYIWYTLGKRYLKHQESGASTEALDQYLAFAPWRSKENNKKYEELIESGWIKPLIRTFPPEVKITRKAKEANK